MTAQTVTQLGQTHTAVTECAMIDDLDELVESTKCSCNAGLTTRS